MNIFTAVKYCCILHGRVCVMIIDIMARKSDINQLEPGKWVSLSPKIYQLDINASFGHI